MSLQDSMGENCTAFDPIEGLFLPQRTTLYHLPPIGAGTPMRESLHSYFYRLADLHCLTPWILAREIVMPKLVPLGVAEKSPRPFFWNSPNFSGVGRVSQAWVEALESLTGIAGLRALTIQGLDVKVCYQQLMAAERQWCPYCIQESMEGGVAYRQLLWEIRMVKACPIHRCRLVTHCGCGGRGNNSYRKPKLLPELCGTCGKLIRTRGRGIPKPATEEEVDRAMRIRDFISSGFFDNGHPEYGMSSGVAEFLQGAARALTDGSQKRLASMIGVSQGHVSMWVNHNHLPTFPHVVSLSRAFHCAVIDVINGHPDAIQGVPETIPRIYPGRGITRKNLNMVELGSKLERFLTMDPPVPFRQAAREIGIDSQYLRRQAKNSAKAITQRYRKWKKVQDEIRDEQLMQHIRKVADEMLAEGAKFNQVKLLERLKDLSPNRALRWEACAFARRLCKSLLGDAA